MSSDKPQETRPADQENPSANASTYDQGAHSFQEKRDFIRMQIESPVQVLIAGETQSVTGICRDLSGGGMLIEVATSLAPGTEVEVTLESSHGHAPMLRATAVVVRNVEIEGDERTSRMGLQLKDILL